MTTPTHPLIDAYVQAVQARVNGYFAKTSPNNKPPVIKAEPSRKYVRLVAEEHDGTYRSAIGFIEPVSGEIYKAAGWKAPAKGVRGRLSDIPAAVARTFPVNGSIS